MRRRLRSCLLVLAAALGAYAPTPAGAKTGVDVISYSVRGKGNVSNLESFAARAVRTYADPRGWSLGGSVRFERVADGGDFTLWLSADALMSTFGGACDVIWSCRNGRNVVINEDRWLGASEAFLAGGGTLDEYRDMVVNHETGHWLGFGHAQCPGPGKAAAVMQQQSMALGGCAFNSWPLSSERAVAAATRHVTVVPPGQSPLTTTTATSPTTSTTRPPTTRPPTTRPPTTGTTTPVASSTTTTRPPAARPSPVRLEDAGARQLSRVPLRPWRRWF
jgi:hypothetical protein